MFSDAPNANQLLPAAWTWEEVHFVLPLEFERAFTE